MMIMLSVCPFRSLASFHCPNFISHLFRHFERKNVLIFSEEIESLKKIVGKLYRRLERAVFSLCFFRLKIFSNEKWNALDLQFIVLSWLFIIFLHSIFCRSSSTRYSCWQRFSRFRSSSDRNGLFISSVKTENCKEKMQTEEGHSSEKE